MGNIISANSAMANICPFTKKELIGKHASELIIKNEDIIKKILNKTAELLEKGFTSYEAQYKNRNGETLDIECNSSMISDKNGDYIAGVSIIRDISKRKLMEVQLQQAQKMEAIGTLAGGIAHDFNNILAAIIGYTEMTLYGLNENIQAQQNLKKVLKSADRAKELVKQILTFSRKNPHEIKPVRLSLIIQDALQLLRPTLPSTIDIQTVVKTDSMIMADPTHMQQLLMNLCTNASHAMHSKNSVLKINLVEINIGPQEAAKYHDIKPGHFIKLSVSDTGTGIDPAIIGRIFEPFFTTKDQGEGTGMGLALVHGIVKNHSGDITIESTINKGTTFHIVLPKIENNSSPVKKQDDVIPVGSESILFVDDEEFLVDVGQKILESLGYRVTAVRNSIDALKLFSATPDKFNLVITDRTMPDLTGYELAEKLIKIRPDIPVILSTGYSKTVSSKKTGDSGIREYIMKPIERRKIAATIRKVLDGVQT